MDDKEYLSVNEMKKKKESQAPIMLHIYYIASYSLSVDFTKWEKTSFHSNFSYSFVLVV